MIRKNEGSAKSATKETAESEAKFKITAEV
jgi:hypothetical protein